MADRIRTTQLAVEVIGVDPYHLTATGIATGPPTVNAPAFTQIHALTALGITTGPPTISIPATTGEHALEALGIATGEPTFNLPSLGQDHTLVALGIMTGPPVLSIPSISPQLMNEVDRTRWVYRNFRYHESVLELTVAAATVDWSYRMLADPRQIKFTSLHTGIVTAWDWDFGDGTNHSTVRNPQHQFEVPTGSDSAEFDVRLTINGAGPFEEKSITVFQLTVLPGANDLDAYTLTVEQANNMTAEQANNMTVT